MGLGAEAAGGDGDDAGAAAHVEDLLARLDAGEMHEARCDGDGQHFEGGEVGPSRALLLLEVGDGVDQEITEGRTAWRANTSSWLGRGWLLRECWARVLGDGSGRGGSPRLSGLAAERLCGRAAHPFPMDDEPALPSHAHATSPTFERLVRAHRRQILALARKHGASDVMVFGSVARGEARDGSDVDFLVTFAPDRSLLDHVAFQQDLEDLLHVKVDVVSREGLSPYIRDAVLREAIPV